MSGSNWGSAREVMQGKLHRETPPTGRDGEAKQRSAPTSCPGIVREGV